MRVTVVGQRPNGETVKRTVTPREFFHGWGPFAEFLWAEARDKVVVINGHKVRVILHD